MAFDTFTKKRLEKILINYIERKIPEHKPIEDFEKQLTMLDKADFGYFWM